MLKIFIALLFTFSASGKNLYDFGLETPKSKPMKLSQFKGSPILLVNIATKCGFTPQLDGLEALHQKYKAKGLKVVGIPTNDFGGQTPENNQEVVKFCKLRYGVTFPLSKKIKVTGDSKHSLFKFLTPKEEIKWNFEKFLFNKEGKLVQRFSSSVSPKSKDMDSAIKKVL